MMVGWAQIKDLALGGGTLAGSGFVVWRILLWLTARFDMRQAQLDAEHGVLDMSWKDYRLLIERRNTVLDARVTTVETQNRALRLSFEHVAGALIRIDPTNPALGLADRLLAQAFGDDFTVLGAQADAAIERAQGGKS